MDEAASSQRRRDDSLIRAAEGAEQQRRESELRYRALVEQSLQGIVLLSARGILYANARAGAILGIPADRLRGMTLEEAGELVHPEDRPQVLDRMRRRLTGEAPPPRYEWRIIRPDGPARWVEAFSARLEGDGEPTIQTVLVDVTERKLAQETLCRAEERMRLALASASEGIWEWNLASGELHLDPVASKILGYSPDDAPLDPAFWIGRIHPEDWTRISGPLETYLRGESEQETVEFRALTKDGQWKWIAGDGRIVAPDDDGRPTMLRGLFRDITRTKAVEEALRASEERYRSLAEASPDAIYVIDTSGTFRFVNAAGARMVGRRPEEMIGRRQEDVFPPDRARQHSATIERLLATGELVVEEGWVPLPDGEHWFDTRLTPLMDAEGKPAGVLGISRDITERKRTEEAVRQSEERYRLMADYATDLISRHAPGGEFLYASPACRRTHGREPEELVGQNPYQWFHPDDLERLEAYHRVLIEDGSPRTVDYRLRGKDGKYLWVETTSRAVFDPSSGEVLEIVSVTREISDRKRAEEAIRESEHRFRLIAENVSDTICRLDPSGVVAYVSPACRTLMGLEPEELLGRNAFEFVHPDDLERMLRSHAELLAAPGSRTIVYRLRHRDGHYLWAETTVNSIAEPASGEVASGVTVTRDITARKEAEEELSRAKLAAEAASRAKGEFLANVSHEIRTPMTAILGYTELLMSVDLTLEQRLEFLRTIHRNAKGLLGLLDDILDLSKIEADRLVAQRTDCSPWEIVEEVLSLMRVRAVDKGLRLDAEYAYPLPATISTDPARLRQILVNLVGNAIKFTDAGEVRVVVRCRTEGEPSPRVLFEVADTGIGMSPDEVARLFKPFTQLDASTTRRFGGTGLGLAISSRLAELLGGGIDVESRAGEGSTFTLAIAPGPLEAAAMLDRRPGAPPPADAAPLPSTGALRGRVLLAEDAPDVQQLVVLLLRRMGLEVEVAESGRAAYERTLRSAEEGRPYALILMDIQMPDWDGYEAARRLREEGWRGPIVALTAYAMPQDRQRCLAAGCDDYIAKPIDNAGLLAVVARHLRQELPAEMAAAGAEETAGAAARPLGEGFIDQDTLDALVRQFAAELPQRAEQIVAAMQERDADRLAHLAHQLKGAAAVYGFPTIAAAADEVCRGVRQGANWPRLHRAVAELADRCRRL
jgi:PAS domain S-box-containing protein